MIGIILSVVLCCAWLYERDKRKTLEMAAKWWKQDALMYMNKYIDCSKELEQDD